MLTNQLSSLLAVGRAPKGLSSIGKFPSSSSCSMSYHPFAPLEPLCNGQPMSRSMHTLPRSNNLRVLETIKIITHKLLGISTGAISVSDSISLHGLHQLNKKDWMATATTNMNTSLTWKPFMSAITTPQLANLSIISRPPQTLLVVSSSILSSLPEFSLLPQLRFALPSSRHSGSRLTKLQKYMAYQNYNRLLLIIFAGVQGSFLPLKECKHGSRFGYNSQIITIHNQLSNPKVFLPPLPQRDSLAGDMTLLSSVKQTRVIGL